MDYAATTPVDPRVVEVMLPFFDQHFGNPSSIHFFGQHAEAAVDEARGAIASQLNCRKNEIIFTSCGSESDNIALRGVALSEQKRRGAHHLLISPVEHHAVSNTALQLMELFGFELEYIHIDQYGMVKPDSVAKQIRPETALVSVIYANNEIGTINPISQIGNICRQFDIPFHTDAVQAAAYLPIDVDELQVDLLSIGAHKFYGPKGVGALYIREGIKIFPSLTGGGQEFSLRAGTHNVPYISGMAAALDIAVNERSKRIKQIQPLRDNLIENVLESIPNSKLSGHPVERLPNHASFLFYGVDGNNLLMLLDLAGFSCSSGSACRSGDPKPSEIITSLGITDEWALGSLRITLGTGSNLDQIESFLEILPSAIENSKR